MIRTLALVLGAALATTTPAAADFWLRVGDGWFYVSNAMIVTVVVVAFIVMVAGVISAERAEESEPSTRESAEEYDDQAARLRALKRKLDAQTELTESQIRAALKDDEAKEIGELLRHGRAKRRR